MSNKFEIEDRKPSQNWTQTPDQYIAKITKNGEDYRAIKDHLEQIDTYGRDSDVVLKFIFDRYDSSVEGQQRIWALVNRRVAIVEFQYDLNCGIEGIKVFLIRK